MTRAGIVVVAAVAVLLTACSGDDTGPAAPPSTATASPTRTPTPGPAAVPPRPAAGACYLLAYDEALAPTTDARPVRCRRPHTAVTYRVGTLDTLVDGHLLAVDAERVQEQVTTECPARFGAFLGATPAQLRLTSLRAVWFTPTLAQSDRGQDWFRCDVIALAGPERLARLEGPMEGVLRTPAGRARFGVCGTAEPGTARFERVICSRPHSWRAISTYDVRGPDYPGERALRRAAAERCQAAARGVAEDTLDYQWGYDWPTAEQWAGGQHYGLCWAPS